jgi:hypothetical protein
MKKLFFLAFAAASCLAAEEAPSKTPQTIDVKRLPAAIIDEVVVPRPDEIFKVLGKVGQRPRWNEVLRKSMGTISPMPDREQTALLLGTVIAEGFIAVEAEDAEEVKKIGKTVLKLSKAIGVEKVVEKRSSAIIEGADKKDWPAVQRELDKAFNDVKIAMIELHDMELSHLVSLGGWVRGTEALTQVVDKNYTKDGAELLHQPALVEYFDRRITEMKPERKSKPVVTQVQKALIDIRPLMGVGGAISLKTVREVRDIAARVVKTIQSKANLKE